MQHPVFHRASGAYRGWKGLYIHSLVAHFLLHSLSAHIPYLHACAHTRMAPVSVKSFFAHVSLISPCRLLPSDDTPIFAVSWRSLRDHSWLRLHSQSHPHDLAVLSRPKSAGRAPLRTCIAKFGYLAKSDATKLYALQGFNGDLLSCFVLLGCPPIHQ